MIGAIDLYVIPLYYVSIKRNVINMRYILKRVLFVEKATYSYGYKFGNKYSHEARKNKKSKLCEQ